MREEPLVSVIIPCYNVENWIGQCLDSVLAQTYQNWEAIIVYSPSTDNTWNIIAKYLLRDKRFKLFPETYKTNVATARNWGTHFSKGEYIAMLDSDDWWDERKLEVLIRVFNSNLDLQWVSHSMIEQYPDHDHLNDLHPGHTMSIGGTGNVIMRRSMLNDIKEKWGYIFNEQMDRNDDADLVLRIRKYPSMHSYYPLSYYRMHDANLTSNTSNWQRLKIIIGMAVRNHVYSLIPYHIFFALLFACGVDPVETKRKVFG